MLHPNPLKRLDASKTCQQILKYCKDEGGSAPAVILRRDEPVRQIYVREVQDEKDVLVRETEETELKEPTLDPITRRETTTSIRSMAVNMTDIVYPGPLKIVNSRPYENSDFNSEVVRSAPSGRVVAYLAISRS